MLLALWHTAPLRCVERNSLRSSAPQLLQASIVTSFPVAARFASGGAEISALRFGAMDPSRSTTPSKGAACAGLQKWCGHTVEFTPQMYFAVFRQ